MDGERIVLCHSLGCFLWMLHAREGGGRVDRVLCVAPPCARNIEPVARFWPTGVEVDMLIRASDETLMVCSSPDPYCPDTAMRAFGYLFPNTEWIPDAGHINTDAGYGPWPWVEQWALGQPG